MEYTCFCSVNAHKSQITGWSLEAISSQLDDGDGWLVPNPEAWVDGLTEGGLEAVDEGHGLAHGVEGEGPPSVVQEHPYAGRIGRSDIQLIFVVAGRVAGVWAKEAPGLAVVPDAAAVPIAHPLDALVGDSDGSPLAAPVHFPVVSSSGQRLHTQDLGEGVKPGSAVMVGLGVPLEGSFPVPSWQVELPVGGVRVQSQRAGI